MNKFLSFVSIVAVTLSSCGSQRGMVGSDTASQLKPVKQIFIEESDLPFNLEIVVSNIADNNYSNKNYFKMYVNNQLIQPQNAIDNTTGIYNYRLKLQPGLYEVKGEYFWNDGWKNEKTVIGTEELIPIDEKGLTRLEKKIPKDRRGLVQGKNLLFSVGYTPFDENLSQISQEKPTDSLRKRISSEFQMPSDRIKLQIHTDPVNSEVYINDELIGFAPISWWVDRKSVNVVQVKAEGYRTSIRVIPPEETYHQDKLVIILRMQPGMNSSKEITAQNASGQQILNNISQNSVPADSTRSIADNDTIQSP